LEAAYVVALQHVKVLAQVSYDEAWLAANPELTFSGVEIHYDDLNGNQVHEEIEFSGSYVDLLIAQSSYTTGPADGGAILLVDVNGSSTPNVSTDSAVYHGGLVELAFDYSTDTGGTGGGGDNPDTGETNPPPEIEDPEEGPTDGPTEGPTETPTPTDGPTEEPTPTLGG
jgi:hypothetical protein